MAIGTRILSEESALGQHWRNDDDPEVSVVIPCLNEAETLAICIEQVQAMFRANHLAMRSPKGEGQGLCRRVLGLVARIHADVVAFKMNP